MILLIASIFATICLGIWSKKEKEKKQNFVIFAGFTLAKIATILTIISAIISIAIGIHTLSEDHFWWWFH